MTLQGLCLETRHFPKCKNRPCWLIFRYDNSGDLATALSLFTPNGPVPAAAPTDAASLIRQYGRYVFHAAYRVLGDSAQSENVQQEVFPRLLEKPVGDVTSCPSISRRWPRAWRSIGCVDINGDQVLSQRMHVAVDEPIDASIFSTRVPAGYRLLHADTE